MADHNNNTKIWQDAVSATKDCPGLEVLEKVMEVSSSDPKTAAHVAECPHCQAEIAMLRGFENSEPSPDEGAAVAWIATQLERQQRATTAKASGKGIPFWRSLMQVRYMAAAAALIIAITVGISLRHSEDGKPGFSSGGSGQTIYRGELHVTTTGDLNGAPQQLTWEVVPGAVSYRVQVSDVTGDKLWEGRSTQNSIDVDPELKTNMTPGKPLNWTVTALDATGKELASGKGKFRVVNK